MLFIRIYKKLPLQIRDKINFLRHRINSNGVLLSIISRIRHRWTLRKLAKFDSPFNLRLGESRKFDGWISSNYQIFCSNFLDATKPFNVEPGAKFVVIDNVLEHLPLELGSKMLNNIYQALIPGGTVRIATPNLRNIVKIYLNPSPQDLDDFRQDFMPHGIKVKFPTDLFNATFNHFGHQSGYIYDFETLQLILREIGFVNIQSFIPGNSNKKYLQNIESRIGKSDLWGQLCVEAEKPNL